MKGERRRSRRRPPQRSQTWKVGSTYGSVCRKRSALVTLFCQERSYGVVGYVVVHGSPAPYSAGVTPPVAPEAR